MAKQYSATYQKTVNSLQGSEFPLILLEITHDDLPSPIRVVNDRADLTHSGDQYVRMGFNISLPDDPETGLPQAKLEIDNVGREMVSWLEIADWNTPTSVRIIQVLRSAPNTVEWEITMFLSNISMTQTSVIGILTFYDPYGLTAIPIVYSPQVAVGLF